MVYLQNTEEAQPLFIPRNESTPDGVLSLVLASTVNLAATYFPEILDIKASALYYFLSVALPEGLPCGEYEYTLKVEDMALSSGVLVIGQDEPAKVTEYQKNINYEQYQD